MAETSLQEQKAPPETVKGSVNPVQQNTVSQSNLFIAGRIKYFIKNWEELITDSFILNVVMGCKRKVVCSRRACKTSPQTCHHT